MTQITDTDAMSRDELCDRIYELEQALIPFAFIGRQFMEPLGLDREYDDARELLRLGAS